VSDLAITQLALPTSLDDADAADFLELTALSNRVMEDAIGSRGFSFTAAEMLPLWARPSQTTILLTGKVDGRLVAWGGYEGMHDAPETFITIEVAPEHRRRGYGTELLTWLLDFAARDDRTSVQARVGSRVRAESRQLVPATGFGSIPADDPGVAFALAHGFSLEQVGSFNQLELPVAHEVFAARQALAAERYEPAYELITWAGAAAAEYRADVGALISAMSTDQPHGALEKTEDIWDAERVRAMDERFDESPRARLTAVAREVSSGKLVAITNMDVPVEPDRSANQWATIVLREHRGHSLGLAVKLANLAQLMRDYPGHPSITTVNAAENEHMLQVNRAMGFEEIAIEGTFQKSI
jgi:GNAT superfamily N-acetyltransferase